ncbi:Threonine/homoserine efflux transporter RhtA [Micromonospora pattaloongensis]|uniref:Threonine/homoserine efflux transporter RhtA n=1 Tax=Micromonospora pattaloongensis TaxID=405436 RepID=A0A1H3FTZ5_9ACTN|nr:DMT family transporter [Micromonospora pattaloongensis]SDX94573.1 Threonine/homoserine efflux transporter RhtA [Micromonospora pattaloongensis]
MRKSVAGPPLVVLSAISFGFLPTFAAYAYDSGLTVFTLLFLRFSIAALLFFGYLAARRRLRLPGGRELASLAVLGGVLYTLQSVTFFSAVRYISPALAVLLLYLFPALVMLLSVVLDRERLSGRRVTAMVVAFAGMGLVLGVPGGAPDVLGVVLAVSAALCYSVYIVFGNRLSSSVSPVATSGYISLFAAVATGLTGAATGTLRFDFAPSGWLPVLGLAVVSTVVAIGAFFAGMSLIGPTSASILSMFEPVVSIVAAWLLLDSPMTVPQLVGGAVVLAGAVLAVTAGRAAPVATAPEPAPQPVS